MIGRNQVIEAQRAQFDLTTLRLPPTRPATPAMNRRYLLRKFFEQSIPLGNGHCVSSRKNIIMPILHNTMAADSPKHHRSAGADRKIHRL
jgi:hypothetical protein